MTKWYIEVNGLLRDIRKKSQDAFEHTVTEEDAAAKLLHEYLRDDYKKLIAVWIEKFPEKELGSLGRHIGFGKNRDYKDILTLDIPPIEEKIDRYLSEIRVNKKGFEKLLHPVIYKNAYQLYRDGHYRDAVLNSIIAVFDLIRERTNLTTDGESLIGTALSSKKPYLILSNLETVSGKNDQIGFLQIFQGAYLGIRNPKAHTLGHDLTEEKAAQYLIFASLLARRIDEAILVKKD